MGETHIIEEGVYTCGRGEVPQGRPQFLFIERGYIMKMGSVLYVENLSESYV